MTIISQNKDLQLLLAVVDCGGFTAAAKLLDVQVARVSRGIARLEKDLNCSLFNRTTRRVELTEEGQVFVQDIRASLQELAKAEERLQNLRGAPCGRLKVDAASPFILHQLVPLVAGFKQLYPKIELELISSENIIDLIEKRTDVAIRIGQLSDSNLHARLLGRSELSIVASPQYIAIHGHPESAQSLSQHTLIGFSSPPQLNIWPLDKDTPIQWDVAASSGETVRQLCLAGNGIALLSNFMIEQDVATNKLIPLLNHCITRPHPRELVNAVYYRNSALSSRISAFLDYIAPRLSL
ncbi:MAG: DNA-binding transcriptional LysR family regulator [Paraglaciecola sp.]|jgi:DNA-binding transcriptional LysR family regulator